MKRMNLFGGRLVIALKVNLVIAMDPPTCAFRLLHPSKSRALSITKRSFHELCITIRSELVGKNAPKVKVEV